MISTSGPVPQSQTSITVNQGYLGCLATLGAGGAAPNPNCTPPASPAPPGAPAPVPAPAPPAAPDPAALAVRFWQAIPLPVPEPTIPPGYAITGKVAYLVTNGTTAPPAYEENTPIGRLTIQATGQYVVDWDDGTVPTWTGPYRAEGRPWPNGQITHTYDNAGTYTVTLREQWSAVWHLAGASGVLGGLATDATIPGLRAEQLQAVITN
ncbi:MAG: hypothetical protein M0Z30_20370 [Actinomycetota bacterium]|nr:hypothetical protein [Actinomycetota bacterium]